MFSQNIHVFVKIFIFVTTPLKVSKYCDFFLNKNVIGSNINAEMLEDGAKFFRIPILFP